MFHLLLSSAPFVLWTFLYTLNFSATAVPYSRHSERVYRNASENIASHIVYLAFKHRSVLDYYSIGLRTCVGIIVSPQWILSSKQCNHQSSDSYPRVNRTFAHTGTISRRADLHHEFGEFSLVHLEKPLPTGSFKTARISSDKSSIPGTGKIVHMAMFAEMGREKSKWNDFRTIFRVLEVPLRLVAKMRCPLPTFIYSEDYICGVLPKSYDGRESPEEGVCHTQSLGWPVYTVDKDGTVTVIGVDSSPHRDCLTTSQRREIGAVHNYYDGIMSAIENGDVSGLPFHGVE